jgi:hypothetical protein
LLLPILQAFNTNWKFEKWISTLKGGDMEVEQVYYAEPSPYGGYPQERTFRLKAEGLPPLLREGSFKVRKYLEDRVDDRDGYVIYVAIPAALPWPFVEYDDRPRQRFTWGAMLLRYPRESLWCTEGDDRWYTQGEFGVEYGIQL